MGDSERVIPFENLPTSDLHVEAVYLGGNQKNLKAEPLGPLVGVGNQGGFRCVGSPRKKTVRLSVLYTSGAEVDWPDSLDPQTGEFTYYGDNRLPGHELHDTRPGGNILLKDAFEAAHGASKEDRLRVPPFLLFEKASPGYAVRFRGLLAPGSATLAPDEELTAIWRSRNGLRFQNYRAKFTVLDVATVPRSWLDAVRGAHLGEKAGNAGVRYADPPAYLAHGHALCAKVANDGLHFRIDARSRKPFASRTRGHGRTITRTADSQASCVGNAGLHQIA